jgi:hypothetical protein
MITFFHGPVISAIGYFFTQRYGSTFEEPNSPFMNYWLIVTKLS